MDSITISVFDFEDSAREHEVPLKLTVMPYYEGAMRKPMVAFSLRKPNGSSALTNGIKAMPAERLARLLQKKPFKMYDAVGLPGYVAWTPVFVPLPERDLLQVWVDSFLLGL